MAKEAKNWDEAIEFEENHICDLEDRLFEAKQRLQEYKIRNEGCGVSDFDLPDYHVVTCTGQCEEESFWQNHWCPSALESAW